MILTNLKIFYCQNLALHGKLTNDWLETIQPHCNFIQPHSDILFVTLDASPMVSYYLKPDHELTVLSIVYVQYTDCVTIKEQFNTRS